MHSLYALKKKEDSEVRQFQWNQHINADFIRSQEFNQRTSDLADRYRSKVQLGVRSKEDSSNSLPQSSYPENSRFAEMAKSRHLWAVDEPLQHHASHHSFRDRVKTAELHHGSISPSKYVPERKRIARNLEAETFDGICWSTVWDKGVQRMTFGNSDRRIDQEIQPHLQFSPRTQKERLEDALARTPGMITVNNPWNQKSSIFYQDSARRTTDKRKWRAGHGKDFKYVRVVPATAPPLSLEWNPRSLHLRQRDPRGDVGGRFISSVPGYVPDVVSGKWGMRQQSSGYRDHWKSDVEMIRHSAEIVRGIYLDKTRLTHSTVHSPQSKEYTPTDTPTTLPINGRMTPENVYLNSRAASGQGGPSPRTRWLQETTLPSSPTDQQAAAAAAGIFGSTGPAAGQHRGGGGGGRDSRGGGGGEIQVGSFSGPRLAAASPAAAAPALFGRAGSALAAGGAPGAVGLSPGLER